ncbi:hypothetical protein LINPERHAP1_LOCUS9061 [Linum perenne]
MAALLNSARYVGTIHNSIVARLRYANHFRTKDIIPSYVFRYEGFDKYKIKSAASIRFSGALPFVGLITGMIDFLGIGISQFLRIFKIYTLRPQSVLNRLSEGPHEVPA